MSRCFPTSNLRLCDCNSFVPLITYINTVIWFSSNAIWHDLSGLWITNKRLASWPEIMTQTWKNIDWKVYKMWHPHKLNSSCSEDLKHKNTIIHKLLLSETTALWGAEYGGKNQRKTSRKNSSVESRRVSLGPPSSHLESFPEGSKWSFLLLLEWPQRVRGYRGDQW